MSAVPAVVEHEQPAAPAMTPTSLIALAVEKGASVEQLTGLMALEERWRANQAKQAFVAALNAFKASPPDLRKNHTVSYGDGPGKTTYDHATLDNVSDTIGAALTPHHLSHRWDVEQTEALIKVTCVLTHILGHSERTSMQAGPDASGKKNSIQAIGSTVTYLQRYTLLAATGMAVKGMDKDGAGDDDRMPEEEYQGWVKKITAATTKEKAKEVWLQGHKACEAISDVDTAGALKTVLLDHSKFIDQAGR